MFDTLIIDELSSAPFPFVLVAAGLVKKRVVLFGDPKQLPPICLAQTDLAKRWLGSDCYQQRPPREGSESQLTEQRRMPPPILELINEEIYGGILHTPAAYVQSCLEDASRAPFQGRQVILVDTSRLSPWCSHDPYYSRFNLCSAAVVRQLVNEEIEPAYRKETRPKVGVVVPYRAQKQVIRKLCESRDRTMPSYLGVHTVHAFQGQERDVIILDLTDSPPLHPGLLLAERQRPPDRSGASAGTTMVKRLLNVAISRTRRKLVVVAHVAYFERELGQQEFVRILLDSITERAGHESEATLVARNDLTAFYARIDAKDLFEHAVSNRTPQNDFFDQATFFAHLCQDLAQCRQSAVIVSPYATLFGVQRLEPAIRSALRRGVNVRIVTKPMSDAAFGRPAIDTLTRLGCSVEERKRLHEKVVILDNRIAYFGSLNVLSHKDTTELMQRIAGEPVSRLVSFLVGLTARSDRTHSVPGSRAPVVRRLDRAAAASQLKKLRWTIAAQRHIPYFAVLYNDTIGRLLDETPTSADEVLAILQASGEKQLNSHLYLFVDEMVHILQRHQR